MFFKRYSIMKFLVTNALYKEFDPQHTLRFPKYSYLEDHPVIGINFYEATVCALWLGRRLPIEKEWEKASRGTDGRDYPWGEAMGYQNEYANSCDFMIGQTSAVAEFEQGLSLLVVLIWLETCGNGAKIIIVNHFIPMAQQILSMPQQEQIIKRVRRGGSWNYHASTLLTDARASDFEHRGNNHFGFRIVKK